jgi:hypothetical protein
MAKFQLQRGTLSDLPSNLDEGDHYLAIDQSPPELYVGPQGSGTPEQVGGSAIIEEDLTYLANNDGSLEPNTKYLATTRDNGNFDLDFPITLRTNNNGYGQIISPTNACFEITGLLTSAQITFLDPPYSDNNQDERSITLNEDDVGKYSFNLLDTMPKEIICQGKGIQYESSGITEIYFEIGQGHDTLTTKGNIFIQRDNNFVDLESSAETGLYFISGSISFDGNTNAIVTSF